MRRLTIFARYPALAAFLQTWRLELTVFLAGMVSVRGLPPYHEQIVMIVGLAVLIRSLTLVTWKRGAWLGFLFGLGHHLLGFSWLLTSLNQHGGIWMGFAVLILALLAATMAIYSAVFGGLLRHLAPRPGLLPLAAPSLWVVSEWLRSTLFSGFPWNLVGYGWSDQIYILQMADLGGVFLLSWFMVFPAAMLALIWIRGFHRGTMMGGGGLVLGVVLVAVGYGAWRIDVLSPGQDAVVAPPLKVGLVQGNVAQVHKWDPKYRDVGLTQYVQLSGAMNESVDLVLWPETAIAFFLQASPEAQKRIVVLSQKLGAPVLTGVPVADKDEHGQWLYYNSVLLLDETGTMARRYDKHHLVPFGEFVPFRSVMPAFIKKLTYGTEDFSRGLGPIPLPWERGAIGVLVCYETIFPREVAQLGRASARWLVNVTNDAWFGELAKPQHLAMAQMRGVENRLPMIRVANTGISAAFDQMGHELGRIAPNVAGSLVIKVPPGEGHSFFQKTEPWWIGLWLYMCLTAWLLGIMHRGQNY
ncbi:MAG: apolipoprotein N-acyltransferase [Magnetococcus sp. THC-1_WYH]